MAAAAGYFTGAAGIPLRYRGDQLHARFLDYAFVCDVGSNLIHRKRLVDEGVRYRGERVDDASELVTYSDIWFRPVQLANAPDGSIHVLDMCRGSAPATIPQLASLTTEKLVALLRHPNGWHRDIAARLIYERQDLAAVETLRQLFQSEPRPEGRLHALYALQGLGCDN